MSRALLSLTTLALVSGVLAGCIGDTDLPEVPDRPELPDLSTALVLDHLDIDLGHTIAADHVGGTENFELLSFHSLAGDGVEFVDGNAEVDYLDGYAYVATLGATSGFVIVDVSNASAPEVVGRYSNPNVYSPDVKVTDDGRYAVLSSHPGTTLATHLPPEANIIPSRVTDPTAYMDDDHVTGVTLVDVSDKANPVRVAQYIAEPNGVHNTEYANIGGRDIIFSVDRNNVAVLEIVSGPTGVRLDVIGQVFADDHWRDSLPGAAGNTNPGSYLPAGSHDVFYEVHPVTQENLIYIAFGRAGFYIYNVDDPTRPSMISNWRGLPSDSGYYHYARPADVLIDDYHVTVVAPEVFNAESSTGTIALLDTTDPKDPKELGTWQLPGEDLFIQKNYRFSPHNFDIQNGTLFMANYHGGVWALDLACSACLFEPANVGYYLPHEETDRIVDGEVVCAFWCERPFVWGVVAGEDGTLYASDVESGLYVLRYADAFWAEPGA